MRKVLLDYRLRWKRPSVKLPDAGTEVLVMFKGKNKHKAVLMYDAVKRVWHEPALGPLSKSNVVFTVDIFAWSSLPAAPLLEIADEAKN